MARKRKTIEVELLRNYANVQLNRTDADATKEFKSGICVMVEKALMLTGNYNGYSHNDVNNCKINTVGYFSRHYW